MAFSTNRKSIESRRAADPVAARAVAVGLLARRDFASGELRDRLERGGFGAATAAAAVAALIEERAVNDARYAENYVSHHAERGKGPVRIAADLKERGVSKELIDTALAGSPDWGSRARELRIRKFGPDSPSDWTEKARQARFLQYRGFSSDHIRSALGADIDLD